MLIVPVLKKIVGSSTKKIPNSNDLDVRIFHLNGNSKNEFHISKKDKVNNIIDYNYWALQTALLDIVNGGPNVFLFNTLYSPDYEPPSAIGLELMENKERFIGNNIIKSGLKFIEKKMNLIKDPSKQVITHKHLYYICSDLSETINIINGIIEYPMELDNKILMIHDGLLGMKESLEVVEDIKNKFLNLKLNNPPDVDWVKNFITKSYELYKIQNTLN